MKLDKRACRHAANAPLNISLNAGVLYTERVKCLVTAAVKLLGGHRALAVYLTSRTCGHLSVEKIPNLTASLRRTATTIPTISMDTRLHLC